MRSILSVRWTLGVLLPCAAWLFSLTVGGAQAQDPSPAGAAKAAHKFLGLVECVDCHRMPNPLRPTDFLAFTESAQWSDNDKHARAFQNFFQNYDSTKLWAQQPKLQPTKRVAAMAALLGWDDITADRRCLSCHANWHQGEARPDPLNISQGVSCESCHGASGDWLGPHKQDPAWRTKPIAEKEKLGMVNVRDPLRRAEQCLSCHVGSAEQGKVVTHEMYAAGHPPLPSIEVETFAEHMPPHWRYMDERPEFTGREAVLKELGYLDRDLHRTKSVLIGGILALRASAQLAGARKAGDPVDFARYDCAACHHDLRTPSWRQKQNVGVPGRPQPAVWPTVLAKVAIQASGGSAAERGKLQKQFDDKLAAMRKAFDGAPFGDAKAAAAASADLAKWLDGLAAKVNKTKLDQSVAESIANQLESMAKEGDYDYESARQIGWAYLTILKEVEHKPKTAPLNEPRFQKILKILQLELPWSQSAKIEDALGPNQLFERKYEPERLRDAFKNLHAAPPQGGASAAAPEK
jgi:hypothetical protein